MDHTIVKGEKQGPDGEWPDHFPPLHDHALVKEEPLEMCSDQEQTVEVMPSESDSEVERAQVQERLDSGTNEMEGDEEFWPLSGKPLFHLILAKTHVNAPYTLSMPVKMIRKLPLTKVPAVLRYCGKNWEMLYLGGHKGKRFDCAGWKAFVSDNNLKAGYGCFFELIECSQTGIKFRVQIIRTDGIAALDEEKAGGTPQTPIFID